MAVDEAEREENEHQNAIKPIELDMTNPFNRTALQNFKRERKKLLKKG